MLCNLNLLYSRSSHIVPVKHYKNLVSSVLQHNCLRCEKSDNSAWNKWTFILFADNKRFLEEAFLLHQKIFKVSFLFNMFKQFSKQFENVRVLVQVLDHLHYWGVLGQRIVTTGEQQARVISSLHCQDLMFPGNHQHKINCLNFQTDKDF